jgi:sulfopyruvate decarboxylase subunit alpha
MTMTPTSLLYHKLREHGIDFFVSVPCKLLSELIGLLERDPEIVYTPVTREEEGVGIIAGAVLGGMRPAMVMQNSGLGNSINAIASLANYFGLPLVFIISHRGTEGEKVDAQGPMGEATEALLAAVGVLAYKIESTKDIFLIDQAFQDRWSRSIAFLFPFSYWR